MHQKESIQIMMHQKESIQIMMHQNESIQIMMHQNESIDKVLNGRAVPDYMIQIYRYFVTLTSKYRNLKIS
jgi:hypothetical protein